MAEENKAIEVLKSKWLGKELVEELTAPTPKELIKTRPIRGGGSVPYVPSPHFIRKLNNCFGFLWSIEYPQTIKDGDQIVAKGRLTLHQPIPKKRTIRKFVEDGKQVEEESTEFEILDVVKEQSGSSEIKRWTSSELMKDKKGNAQKDKEGNLLYKHRAGDVIDLGDDYKGAQTDAMKKCATQFGVFLDVYETRASGDEGGGISEGQLETFYFRAEEAGMTSEEADKWAEGQLGKLKAQWTGYDLMLLVAPLMDIAEAKKKEKGE
jgi:hypothetical protein